MSKFYPFFCCVLLKAKSLTCVIASAQGASGLGDHQPTATGLNGKFADFNGIVIRMVFQELGMDFNFDGSLFRLFS